MNIIKRNIESGVIDISSSTVTIAKAIIIFIHKVITSLTLAQFGELTSCPPHASAFADGLKCPQTIALALRCSSNLSVQPTPTHLLRLKFSPLWNQPWTPQEQDTLPCSFCCIFFIYWVGLFPRLSSLPGWEFSKDKDCVFFIGLSRVIHRCFQIKTCKWTCIQRSGRPS